MLRENTDFTQTLRFGIIYFKLYGPRKLMYEAYKYWWSIHMLLITYESLMLCESVHLQKKTYKGKNIFHTLKSFHSSKSTFLINKLHKAQNHSLISTLQFMFKYIIHKIAKTHERRRAQTILLHSYLNINDNIKVLRDTNSVLGQIRWEEAHIKLQNRVPKHSFSH